MMAHLNTIFRTMPGFLTYVITMLVIILGVTTCFYFIFSPFLSDFNTFGSSFIQVTSGNMLSSPEFRNLIADKDYSLFGLFSILLQQL